MKVAPREVISGVPAVRQSAVNRSSADCRAAASEAANSRRRRTRAGASAEKLTAGEAAIMVEETRERRKLRHTLAPGFLLVRTLALVTWHSSLCIVEGTINHFRNRLHLTNVTICSALSLSDCTARSRGVPPQGPFWMNP